MESSRSTENHSDQFSSRRAAKLDERIKKQAAEQANGDDKRYHVRKAIPPHCLFFSPLSIITFVLCNFHLIHYHGTFCPR